MIGAYILSWVCLIMIGFVIVEQPWEDSIITMQHIFNEIVLYLILLIVIICGLPLSPNAVGPAGWVLILLVLTTVVFNLAIIAYATIMHLTLFAKRHHKKIKWLFKKQLSVKS